MMRRLLLLCVIVVSALAGAVAAKLDSRWNIARGTLCSHVPCKHFQARISAIESVIAQREAERNYLAIGDSIVELADLPPICDRKPINGGIGGATVETFRTQGRRLAELAKPDFIVIELGAAPVEPLALGCVLDRLDCS
jgi:hypothetical protein